MAGDGKSRDAARRKGRIEIVIKLRGTKKNTMSNFPFLLSRLEVAKVVTQHADREKYVLRTAR